MGNKQTISKEVLQKQKLQELLNIEFRRTITRRYQVECDRKGIEPTFDGLIQFAHEHALIRTIDINRYMVLDQYPKALFENDGCRREAVFWIENKVPVSDRTIWNWIKDFSKRYRKHRHGESK